MGRCQPHRVAISTAADQHTLPPLTRANARAVRHLLSAFRIRHFPTCRPDPRDRQAGAALRILSPPPIKLANRLSLPTALHKDRKSSLSSRAPAFSSQAQYHTVSNVKPVSPLLRRGLFALQDYS